MILPPINTANLIFDIKCQRSNLIYFPFVQKYHTATLYFHKFFFLELIFSNFSQLQKKGTLNFKRFQMLKRELNLFEWKEQIFLCIKFSVLLLIFTKIFFSTLRSLIKHPCAIGFLFCFFIFIIFKVSQFLTFFKIFALRFFLHKIVISFSHSF